MCRLATEYKEPQVREGTMAPNIRDMPKIIFIAQSNFLAYFRIAHGNGQIMHITFALYPIRKARYAPHVLPRLLARS